eukprot:Sspe_Gene.114567::Locus_100370_Transcript_1_1_Confidence_1.000_Length_432::g.114567::m.114567
MAKPDILPSGVQRQERRSKQREKLHHFLTFSRVLHGRRKNRISEGEAAALLLQSKLLQPSGSNVPQCFGTEDMGWREGRAVLRMVQQQSREVVKLLEKESLVTGLIATHHLDDTLVDPDPSEALKSPQSQV